MIVSTSVTIPILRRELQVIDQKIKALEKDTAYFERDPNGYSVDVGFLWGRKSVYAAMLEVRIAEQEKKTCGS